MRLIEDLYLGNSICICGVLIRSCEVDDHFGTLFPATLRVEGPGLGETNTLNINRLLKRLEGSISRGNHAEAARLAHELAELRVSCSVVRNKTTNLNQEVAPSVPLSSTNLSLPTTSSKPPNSPTSPPTSPLLSRAWHVGATNSDPELPGTRTPTSSLLESFYDASEMLDNEEIMSTSEHDNLLDFSIVDNLLESGQKVEQKDDPKLNGDNDPSNAAGPSSSPSLLPSTTTPQTSAQLINGAQLTTGEVHAAKKGQEEATENKSSPVANKRDNKVDPARREVKSDTISKLSDGPPVYMKDLNEDDLPFK